MVQHAKRIGERMERVCVNRNDRRTAARERQKLARMSQNQ
jgi:hypothetical protein